MTSKTIILVAIGSNSIGHWGSPQQSLARAIEELNFVFNGNTKVSCLHTSRAVGGVRQPDYWNAVIRIEGNIPPARFLMFLKRLEREAGRKGAVGTRWGPRPLDLDIIDCGHRVNGWYAPRHALRPSRRPDFLILPHPQAHLRRFVLQPLLEVEPYWRHPALCTPGQTLLRRLPNGVAVPRPKRGRA